MGLSAEANQRLSAVCLDRTCPGTTLGPGACDCKKMPAGLLKTHVGKFIPREAMPEELIINGAIVSVQSLVSILNQITNPIPGRWYHYERQGESIIVTVKQEETK